MRIKTQLVFEAKIAVLISNKEYLRISIHLDL